MGRDEVTAAIYGLLPAVVNHDGRRQDLALEPVTPVAGPRLGDGILQSLAAAIGIAIEKPENGIERAPAHKLTKAFLQLL